MHMKKLDALKIKFLKNSTVLSLKRAMFTD